MRRKKIIVTVLIAVLVIAGGAALFILTGTQENGQMTEGGQKGSASSGNVSSRMSSEQENTEQESPEQKTTETAEGGSGQAEPDPPRVTGRNEHIFAHRGASGEEVEHTIKAYDLAIRQGADHIEQDVVLSKEGTLYVSHDDTAGRITGVNRKFSDMTDEEIDERTTYDGQRILRLAHVFDRYGKDVVYVVELKDQGEATDKLIELIGQKGVEGNIIVQCEQLSALEKVRSAYAGIPTLYLADNPDEFSEALGISYVDIVSVNKKYMSQDDCNRAHENRKQYNIWTLDEEEEIRRAIEIGADSYFTDYPGRAVALEQQYRP